MSAALRTSLRFFEIGVVATACSLASAVFVELILPSYDASRNRALQAIEGIVGMTLHYLLGLELFLAAYPLTGLYPATVFAVLTPVMVPTSLAKMSGTMRGLSKAIEVELPYTPEPPGRLIPEVPLPSPGSLDFDKWIDSIDKRLSEAAIAMRQEMTALTANGRAYIDATGQSVAAATQEYTDLRAAQLVNDMDRLRRDMHMELISTVSASELALKGWSKAQAQSYKQKLDNKVAGWEIKLAQLEQTLQQHLAAVKSNYKKSIQCRNQPGHRMVTSYNNALTPECGTCPGGYQWMPINDSDVIGHDTRISLANEVCKPVKPEEPVVVVDPGTTNNGYTWDNPKPGVVLARGTVAFKGDPKACEKFYMSLADPKNGSHPEEFFDACGRQYQMANAVTDPNTGEVALLQGCVTGLLGKDGKAGFEEQPLGQSRNFIEAVKYPTGKSTYCNKCMACNNLPCDSGSCVGAMKSYEKQNNTERVSCDEDSWSAVTDCK